MGKQLVLNDTQFEDYIDTGTINTTNYTDVTTSFINTYNLEIGFYQPTSSVTGKVTLSNKGTNTEALIKRFVAIDFVPKSEGDFIVVIPSSYITTSRYLTMNVSSWNGESTTNGSFRSDNLGNDVNIHSDRVIQLNSNERTNKWAFQCGVATGSVISIETLLSNGFKVYKKNS